MPVARHTLIAVAALAVLAAPAGADSTGLVSARVGQPPLSDAAAAKKVGRSTFEPRPANASAFDEFVLGPAGVELPLLFA